jgi:DNA-binding NtrC family response regulator
MPQSAKPIVLIVEDEALIRMLAADAFLEAGFEVPEAEHAAEALLVHGGAAEVHVLFTDVSVPGELNGIDLAERLKAVSPALHVIITSAPPILRPVEHLPAIFAIKPYDPGSVSQAALALIAA